MRVNLLFIPLLVAAALVCALSGCDGTTASPQSFSQEGISEMADPIIHYGTIEHLATGLATDWRVVKLPSGTFTEFRLLITSESSLIIRVPRVRAPVKNPNRRFFVYCRFRSEDIQCEDDVSIIYPRNFKVFEEKGHAIDR